MRRKGASTWVARVSSEPSGAVGSGEQRAGVVDQPVEVVRRCADRFGERTDGVGVDQVDRTSRLARAAPTATAVRRVASSRSRSRPTSQTAPSPGQLEGGGPPDPRGGTGHHDHLVVEAGRIRPALSARTANPTREKLPTTVASRRPSTDPAEGTRSVGRTCAQATRLRRSLPEDPATRSTASTAALVPGARPDVAAQSAGVRGRSDGVRRQDDRDVRGRGPDRHARRGDLGVEPAGGRTIPTATSVPAPHCLGHRLGGRVPAEFDHLEAPPPQQVRHDGHRQRVESPAGAASATVPRSFLAGRTAGPRRPITRWATAVARCSSATETSPVAHRSPMDRRAGTTRPVQEPGGSNPPLEVTLDQPPGARHRRRPASVAPGLAIRLVASPRRAPPPERACGGPNIGRSDPPLGTPTSPAADPGGRTDRRSCSGPRGARRPRAASASSCPTATGPDFSTKLTPCAEISVRKWATVTREEGSRREGEGRVVGSGVAGLTAAYPLQRRFDVTLYESEDRLGGHAHTHDVVTADAGSIPVDTGFIVFNESTYPQLCRLFAGFGRRHAAGGDEHVGPLRRLRARVRGRPGPGRGPCPPAFGGTPAFVKNAARSGGSIGGPRRPSSAGTSDHSAIVSGRRPFFPLLRPPFRGSRGLVGLVRRSGTALEYPARYLFTFLDNHGMLSVTGSPAWRTVVGGSRTYVERIVKGLPAVHHRHPRAIVRARGPVEIRDECDQGCSSTAFVVATHADTALELLHPRHGRAGDVRRLRVLAQRDVAAHRRLAFLPISHPGPGVVELPVPGVRPR